MVLNTKRHTRIQFDEDLERALQQIKDLGRLVERQLTEAVALFRIEDKSQVPAKAEEIIANDRLVNEAEVEISDACLYLIAKHQPKANDLRLVFAILRAASEYERIGDTVSKICDTARNSEKVINSLIEKIEHFTEHAITLLHKSTDALVNMDLTYASENYVNDNHSEEYKNIFRSIVEEAKHDTDHLKEYFRASITLRQIERIGDRCRNINEFVYYYAKGITANSDRILKVYHDTHDSK